MGWDIKGGVTLRNTMGILAMYIAWYKKGMVVDSVICTMYIPLCTQP